MRALRWKKGEEEDYVVLGKYNFQVKNLLINLKRLLLLLLFRSKFVV